MEVVSLVIASLSALAAVGAVVYARRSADASDRSAGAAEVSAEAAQRSAEVAERSEARQTERNDVVWTPTVEKGEDSRWVLRNSGLDAAVSLAEPMGLERRRSVVGVALGVLVPTGWLDVPVSNRCPPVVKPAGSDLGDLELLADLRSDDHL